MPTSKRRRSTGVMQRLVEQPYRFQFFQAVRILEHVFVRQGDLPAEVVSKRLRFLNTLNLSFPASEIEKLDVHVMGTESGETASDAWSAADMDLLQRVSITPAFFGMLGANGTLPLTYTERLGEREVFHRDRAARAFLDIFSNRAVALFYASWKKYRLALQYELDSKSRFLGITQALSGLAQGAGGSSKAGRKGPISDEALAYYCGAVQQRPMSTAFIQQLLSDYFAVAIRIEQFAGDWHSIPEAHFARLGHNAVLGHNSLVGERVWQRDLKLRLWIGPLTRSGFEDFLPCGSAATALSQWLTLLAGPTFTYEVRLILSADHVQGLTLSASKGGRLGWDAFMVSTDANCDRDDAHYPLATQH